MKRSDQSLAIYGVLAIGAIGLIGYIVLLALGRDVPDALLAVVVASALSGVLGWARGGTYYNPTPEVIPAPVVDVEPAPVVAEAPAPEPLPIRTPAVYPLPGSITPDRIGPAMAAAQPAAAATPAEVAARSEVTP